MSEDIQLMMKLGLDAVQAQSNLGSFYQDFKAKLKEMGASNQEIGFFLEMQRDIQAGKVSLAEFSAETQKLLSTFEQGRNIAAARDFLGVPAHAQVREEIDKTRAAYDTLKASGQLTGTELAQAALKTDEKIRQLEHSTNGWSKSLTNAKGAFVAMAGSAAGMTAVVKEAVQFEEAMADVAKVVDGSDEQMASLSKRIRELSTELPISADGLAQIAAAGGQLGIPIENLEQFIQVAAKMSTAFGMSAEEAGNSMAKLMNVFGLSLTEVEKLGDAVNVLGNTTAAREADIVQFITRVGGSAKQFGLAADQAAALGTALISMGTAPEVAANGINALLSKLQTANVQGTEFKEGLARIGLSAEQLAADIRADPQAALQEFLKTLEKLDGQSRAEVLTKLFGLEYQDDISRLVGSLGLYEQALANIGDKSQVAGAMGREFEKRMQTTAAQLDLLKNAVETAAINLGTVLLPAINGIVEPLADAAGGVASFIEAFPKISGLAATLGTALASVSALKLGFDALNVIAHKAGDSIAEKFTQASLPIGEATKEIGKLNTAISLMSAAMVGWDIGTYLRENFETARLAGVGMVDALVHGAEEVQYGWEQVQALFTDDTLDAAQQRHEERLRRIKGVLDGMYAEAKQGPQELAAATTQAVAAQDTLAKSGQQAGAAVQAGMATATAATAAVAERVKQLDADLKSLGLDPEQFKDPEAKIVQTFERIASHAEVSGDQVLAALLGSLERISQTSAPDLEFALQEAFQKGKISADQLAVGMDAIQSKMDGIWPAVDQVESAFKRLGVTSDAALKQAAAAAKADFETIQQSGQASARALQEAFTAYAERAIAANGGVADAAIKGQAAYYGLKVEAGSSGDTIVSSMASAEESTHRVGHAARGAADEVRSLAREAEEARKAFEAMNDERLHGAEAAAKSTRERLDAMASASGNGIDTILGMSDAELRDYISRSSGQSDLAGYTQAYNQYARDELARRMTEQRGNVNPVSPLLPVDPKTGSSPTPAQRSSGATSTSHMVTVNLGGQPRTINTASPADSVNLVRLIQQLELASMASR